MNFSTTKNGYNKKEVDLYIQDLNTKIAELEQTTSKDKKELENYRKKDKELNAKQSSISVALTAAVEKAKQIEKSSENVYKLKIQQVNLLYAKWEKLLNVILEKYPQIEEVENVKQLLKDFKNNIKATLKDDYKIYSSNSPVKTDNDTIRLLLQKLGSYSKSAAPTKTVKVERKQLSKDMLNSQTELSRIEDKAPLIKPIYKNNLQDNEYENLADKFLSEDDQSNSAYSSIITSKSRAVPEVNETGFDLKEAVNPKDDLDEIMKAFDFFNED